MTIDGATLPLKRLDGGLLVKPNPDKRRKVQAGNDSKPSSFEIELESLQLSQNHQFTGPRYAILFCFI
jgi:hypothetical protein